MDVHFLAQLVVYAIPIYCYSETIKEKLREKTIEKLLEKIIEVVQEDSRDDAGQEIIKYLLDPKFVRVLATGAALHIANIICQPVAAAGLQIAEHLVKISIKYVVVPIKIQLNYLLCYKSNIEGFRTQMKDLENARENVGGRVDSAKREDKDILPNVLEWQEKVDKIIVESRKIFEDELQLNLKLYYQRSKYAKKNTADVVELTKKGNSFDRLAYDSRELVLKNIMQAVNDDCYNMIGIYGVCGVGKTALAKQVQQQAEEGKMFGLVVMSLVSESPDFKRIQGEIADMLHRKLDANTASRKRQKLENLFERLKKIKKFLIILDDVWKEFKLADIGIPFGKKHSGCKILLTSRSEEVCNKCFSVNTSQNFLIKASQNFLIKALTKGGRKLVSQKVFQLAGDC